MKLTELLLNRFLYRQSQQSLETQDAVYDSANIIPVSVPPLPAGSAAQDINTSNVFINGNQLEPGSIPPDVLDVSNWGWGQTCAFSSTDLNTVSWGSGSFTSANGNVYSIGAGNTGNMAAKTYIYLDLNISKTAYQITTTPATAVGVGKVLIAVAENAAVAATYNLSEATQIVGDNILANTINASKMDVGQLSAITADLGQITAGAIDLGTNAWHIDEDGNMWWQAYGTFTAALAGKAPTISSAGNMQFLRIANSENIASFGLDIRLTHASNTAAGVQILQQGAGFGMIQTISGSSRGIYIANSGSGKTIEIVNTGGSAALDITANVQSAAVIITNNVSGGNPTGLKLDVSNSSGDGYAFEFAGDIVGTSGFTGAITRKIRVLIGGSVYYMYLYDA